MVRSSRVLIRPARPWCPRARPDVPEPARRSPVGTPRSAVMFTRPVDRLTPLTGEHIGGSGAFGRYSRRRGPVRRADGRGRAVLGRCPGAVHHTEYGGGHVDHETAHSTPQYAARHPNSPMEPATSPDSVTCAPARSATGAPRAPARHRRSNRTRRSLAPCRSCRRRSPQGAADHSVTPWSASPVATRPPSAENATARIAGG